MRSIRNLAPEKLLLLVVLSICQIPGVANAQSTNLQGRFHLPSEAHWGQAVLPAGDYTFTVDLTKDATPLVVVRSADGKSAAFALATSTSTSEPGGSYVYITDDGTRRVRLLNLSAVNISLSFGPLTKRDREQMYATRTEIVPVAVAQN